ncbi:flagellar protein F [Saccharolobus caldissimus]|uniref:Conserved flagellar protein F immunoglobulin-like domain-containing protein n=1 Tax=Saccharolobus caldissimus TaxID=1702097 RepID=A0AAQ4CT30_9CREN|nr:flagellar protein F [Saccharolobus caldissimus]BDB98961.1 hypothetical protein SACC_19780 [Saccharolobus caldissimus]
MGVSQVVAYALIIFISISLGLIVLGTYIRSQQILTYAYEIKQVNQLNQLDTRIFIKNIYLSGNLLYVTITNNGTTSLYEFNNFAVIIKYYANISNISTLIVSQYNYSKTIGPYEWTTSSIIINPSSSGVLVIELPYKPYPNTQATVVIATNYGPEAIWRGVL